MVLAAVLAAGLLGGWVAGRQRSSPSGGHGHAHGGGDEEGGHEGHDHGPVLGAATLANLGVEIGEAAVSEFVRTLDVPATVEPVPQAERALASPVAGVVRAVHARPGEVAAPGAVLLEVLRDAFPPPSLTLTEAVIRPLNEEYHQAVVGLGGAALALRQAEAEIERLAGLARDPSGAAQVAARVLRDAEYARDRARIALESAIHEAERHGLTEGQIAALQAADSGARAAPADRIPDTPDIRRVLERNRLWSQEADRILGRLDASIQGLPHTLAILGELAAAGRLTPALLAALEADPRLRGAFLDIAGLVQAGTTPAALLALAERGGLDPVIRLQAPTADGALWDVLDVRVRAGERVEAGATALVLRDDRTMRLRLHPAPSDLVLLARALEASTPLEAEPLVRGSAGPIAGVHLLGLTGADEGGSAGALAQAANVVLKEAEVPGGGRLRTWALRPGLKLVVRVPVERKPGRFVLPADAIAYRGAEAVVLLRTGTSFRAVPVRLEHHDARVAVVAADGAIFPGDPIVLRGAPALALGLLAGAGGADPHAGHDH